MSVPEEAMLHHMFPTVE